MREICTSGSTRGRAPANFSQAPLYSTEDHHISLKNSAGFPDAEFIISNSIPKSPLGAWDNYVKAAAQALQRYANEVDHSMILKGFNAVVDGTIPAGAGLSSSAAPCGLHRNNLKRMEWA